MQPLILYHIYESVNF